jgi:sulfur carrier protein ThiS
MMGSFKVKLNGRFVRVKLKKGMSVADVMHQLAVNRETHLAMKNGKLVSELEEVSERDRVEIFQVVYGG